MSNVTMSDMYCTQCGKKNIPIPRRKGSAREDGHLKKMYCIHCGQTTNMVEVRGFGKYDAEMFHLEYEYNNFTTNGERKLSLSEFKAHIRKGGDVLK